MRMVSLMLLVFALGACSSDDATEPERPVDPSALRLQIVSGDRQTAPVASSSGAAAAPLAQVGSAAELPANLLPEPLVARIVVAGSPSSPLASQVVLPAGIAVTFRVIQPTGAGDRHCGSSFIDAAVPDAEGYVTTYWELGTYAEQPCRMEARLVVDREPRVDTVFTAQFQPGPVARFRTKTDDHGFVYASPGDTLDGTTAILGGVDRYGNLIPPAMVRAAVPDSMVRWWWCGYGQGSRGCYESAGPAATIGTGWTIVAPPVWDGEMAGLRIWLQGSTSDYPAFVKRPGT